MTQSTHGLEQNQALTRAAGKLSEAKAADKEWGTPESAQRLEDAQRAYDDAFQVYTNPFKVAKYVWPDGTLLTREYPHASL